MCARTQTCVCARARTDTLALGRAHTRMCASVCLCAHRSAWSHKNRERPARTDSGTHVCAFTRSLACPPCLSRRPSTSHACVRAHTHTRTDTHTHTHTRTVTHARKCVQACACTPCAPAHGQTSCAPAPVVNAATRARTHTHMCARTHACAQVHAWPTPETELGRRPRARPAALAHARCTAIPPCMACRASPGNQQHASALHAWRGQPLASTLPGSAPRRRPTPHTTTMPITHSVFGA